MMLIEEENENANSGRNNGVVKTVNPVNQKSFLRVNPTSIVTDHERSLSGDHNKSKALSKSQS